MAADGEGATGLSKAHKALARRLGERMAASLLPGEAALPAGPLGEAAGFLLEAALEREEGKPAILLRSVPGERLTRVAVINEDMPFLVDSVAATVAAQGLAIDRLMHPIVPVEREDGRLAALPDEASRRESMIYLETARVDAKDRRALEKALATTLADVRAAVADWPEMTARITADANGLADPEGAELLRWFGGGMLTLLGHLTVARDCKSSDALGICRKSARELLADDSCQLAFGWFDAHGTAAPLIVKANRLSNVHRRVPLDLFIVPIVAGGRVAALSIHAGMWTSAALATPPDEVPLLRRQLAETIAEFAFAPGSHDAKALVHALTTLPHDVIIGFSHADITRVATAMMALADRPRPRIELVAAPLARHLFAFVWLPRDALSTEVREEVQAMLEEETGTATLDWSLMVEGSTLAMLRYVLDFRGQNDAPDPAAIDSRLQAMLRGWSEAVESELAKSVEPGRAAALAARYAEAFPHGYRIAFGPAEAARDIERLRPLATPDPDRPLGRDARLYRLDGDAPGELRLSIYQQGGSMPLSDAVPALENFGFRVLSEFPTELAGIDHATVHDFRLALPREDHAEVLARAGAIELAIAAVLNGLAEDDVFNRLVVGTALEAREADWLRAFYRYLRQAGLPFTIYTVVDALRAAPEVTRGLVRLLHVCHDPAFAGDREAAGAEAQEAIRQGLTQVAAINDDRLLRRYWATIGAIVRTNAFAPAAREALAFKFDSARVPGLPKPVPWREIWVYSRRVEGIHLRAGPVARGGIRWSDRRDDFRTEILGLMKAQRVKNAVIVPTGA
jgi:glutamate dehydrogenase